MLKLTSSIFNYLLIPFSKNQFSIDFQNIGIFFELIGQSQWAYFTDITESVMAANA